jgi:hypothetical protein
MPQRIASFPSIPTVDEWKKKSCVGSAYGGPYRRNDPGLVRIDTIVDAYSHTKNTGTGAGGQQYLLGELFFATLHWHNHYKQDKCMEAGRAAAIMSLNLTCANVLATAFQCPLGNLGEKLNKLFGKSMTEHGINMDKDRKQFYLDGAQRENYRIIFVGGLAFQLSEMKDPKAAPVLFDTTRYGEMMKRVGDDGRHGECGFVLSMSDELYAGPLLSHNYAKYSPEEISGKVLHISVNDRVAQVPLAFHSSFMGGKPVQCAGMITVHGGVFEDISTQSGHYAPGAPDLLKMLKLLRSVGADLKKTDAWECMPVKINGKVELEYGGHNALEFLKKAA